MHSFWVAFLVPFVGLIVWSLVRYASWILFPLIPRALRRALFTDYVTGEYLPPAAGRRAKD